MIKSYRRLTTVQLTELHDAIEDNQRPLLSELHEVIARLNTGDGSNTPNRKTALQRLVERYRRFSRMSLILAGCIPLCLYSSLRHDVDVPEWQLVVFMAFMTANDIRSVSL